MKIFNWVLVGISILILLASIFQWGSKPIPILGAVLFIAILAVPLLLFYKLSITIDAGEAIIQFGIGLLRRKININNLDLSTAQVIDLPWQAGVGYRISTEGAFFNTRPGPALFI